MSDDGAEVIQLRPGQDQTDDDRPLATGPRPDRYCGHRRTELANEERRVYCRDCGREVPAFDVLKMLASDTERWISHRREAERRAKVAQGHLDDLLRDERNAKSRRRTWKRREPEAVRLLRALVERLDRLGARRGIREWEALDEARDFLDAAPDVAERTA